MPPGPLTPGCNQSPSKTKQTTKPWVGGLVFVLVIRQSVLRGVDGRWGYRSEAVLPKPPPARCLLQGRRQEACFSAVLCSLLCRPPANGLLSAGKTPRAMPEGPGWQKRSWPTLFFTLETVSSPGLEGCPYTSEPCHCPVHCPSALLQ